MEQRTLAIRDSPGESPPRRYPMPPGPLLAPSSSCPCPSLITTAKDGSEHHVPGLDLLLAFRSACGVGEEPARQDKVPGLCAWEKRAPAPSNTAGNPAEQQQEFAVRRISIKMERRGEKGWRERYIYIFFPLQISAFNQKPKPDFDNFCSF